MRMVSVVRTCLGGRHHDHVLVIHELNFVNFEGQLPSSAISVIECSLGCIVLCSLSLLDGLRHHSLLFELRL